MGWVRPALLAAVAAPTLFGWLAGCSLVEPRYVKPHVTVAKIAMAGGSLLQQNFIITLNIDNPNARVLPVTSLHAELNVAGDRVASGVSTRAFVVPAHGSTRFDMAVTANVGLALLKLLQNPEGHGAAIDYDMTGGASIDLPFLRDLPFHQRGSFALPR